MIYLYIKQCPHCGLKYFGKTIKKDPHSYRGSGTRWTNHLRYHKVTPETVQVWSFTQEEATTFALEFSSSNNIVESEDWANLMPETGSTLLDDHRRKISENQKGRIFSEEHRKKLSEASKGNTRCLGRILSNETKKKISETKKDMSYETRMKMSLASKGIPKSDEHRRKMSEAQKLRWYRQRINIHELQTGAA